MMFKVRGPNNLGEFIRRLLRSRGDHDHDPPPDTENETKPERKLKKKPSIVERSQLPVPPPPPPGQSNTDKLGSKKKRKPSTASDHGDKKKSETRDSKSKFYVDDDDNAAVETGTRASASTFYVQEKSPTDLTAEEGISDNGDVKNSQNDTQSLQVNSESVSQCDSQSKMHKNAKSSPKLPPKPKINRPPPSLPKSKPSKKPSGPPPPLPSKPPVGALLLQAKKDPVPPVRKKKTIKVKEDDVEKATESLDDLKGNKANVSEKIEQPESSTILTCAHIENTHVKPSITNCDDSPSSKESSHHIEPSDPVINVSGSNVSKTSQCEQTVKEDINIINTCVPNEENFNQNTLHTAEDICAHSSSEQTGDDELSAAADDVSIDKEHKTVKVSDNKENAKETEPALTNSPETEIFQSLKSPTEKCDDEGSGSDCPTVLSVVTEEQAVMSEDSDSSKPAGPQPKPRRHIPTLSQTSRETIYPPGHSKKVSHTVAGSGKILGQLGSTPGIKDKPSPPFVKSIMREKYGGPKRCNSFTTEDKDLFTEKKQDSSPVQSTEGLNNGEGVLRKKEGGLFPLRLVKKGRRRSKSVGATDFGLDPLPIKPKPKPAAKPKPRIPRKNTGNKTDGQNTGVNNIKEYESTPETSPELVRKTISPTVTAQKKNDSNNPDLPVAAKKRPIMLEALPTKGLGLSAVQKPKVPDRKGDMQKAEKSPSNIEKTGLFGIQLRHVEAKICAASKPSPENNTPLESCKDQGSLNKEHSPSTSVTPPTRPVRRKETLESDSRDKTTSDEREENEQTVASERTNMQDNKLEINLPGDMDKTKENNSDHGLSANEDSHENIEGDNEKKPLPVLKKKPSSPPPQPPPNTKTVGTGATLSAEPSKEERRLQRKMSRKASRKASMRRLRRDNLNDKDKLAIGGAVDGEDENFEDFSDSDGTWSEDSFTDDSDLEYEVELEKELRTKQSIYGTDDRELEELEAATINRKSEPQFLPIDDCHKIVHEVLTTERSYVKKLYLIDQVFHFEVLTRNRTEKMFPDDVIPKMFSNIKSIYQFHNDFLLPQLEKRLEEWEDVLKIGDVFKKFAPFLKLYTDYVKNYHNATETISYWKEKCPAFGTLMDELQAKPECGSLRLLDHMLGPIQRIPRYELLLRDYLKHLPAESADRQDTEMSLEIVNKAATHSNEAMRKIDKFRKLLDISDSLIGEIDLILPGRELIKEGKITKISGRRGEQFERYLFLFNDMLLVCQSVSLVGLKHQYKIKAKLDVEGMRVLEGENILIQDTFLVKGKQKSLELLASSSDEKLEWQRTLWSVISEFTKKQLSRHGNPACLQTMFDEKELGKRAPTWIKDKDTSMCMQCSVGFTMVRRRHHCRACGMVVCSGCSSRKAKLAYDNDKENRVCDKCFLILEGKGEEIAQIVPSHIQDKRNVLKVKAQDPAVMSGYLSFSTDKKTWTKKWIIAREDFVMYFFKAHKDVIAEKTLPLPGFKVQEDENMAKSFKLYHQGQKEATEEHFFEANDKSASVRWIDVLTKLVVAELPSPTDIQRSSDLAS